MPDMQTAMRQAVGNQKQLEAKPLPERIWLLLREKPKRRSNQIAHTLNTDVKRIQHTLTEMKYRQVASCEDGRNPNGGRPFKLWSVHPNAQHEFSWGPRVDMPSMKDPKPKPPQEVAPTQQVPRTNEELAAFVEGLSIGQARYLRTLLNNLLKD